MRGALQGEGTCFRIEEQYLLWSEWPSKSGGEVETEPCCLRAAQGLCDSGRCMAETGDVLERFFEIKARGYLIGGARSEWMDVRDFKNQDAIALYFV